VTPSAVLSINAADPTGFGGLAADLRTFAAHELHGASILTSVSGISSRYPLPVSVVALELSMALAELRPAATKIGIFGTGEIAAAVGTRVRAGELPNLVLDPVLEGSSGFRRGVIGAVLRLLPFTSVLTPNVDEAGELVGWPVTTTADMAGAAAQLVSRGAKFVVVTGGRLSGEESVDAIWTDGGVRFLHAPRVPAKDVRGGGTTFSAAIAARLALGADVHEAVTSAKEYVTKALVGAKNWRIGIHAGPVDNLGFTMRQEMIVRSSVNPLEKPLVTVSPDARTPGSSTTAVASSSRPSQRAARPRPAAVASAVTAAVASGVAGVAATASAAGSKSPPAITSGPAAEEEPAREMTEQVPVPAGQNTA
jgi:hydroxymethylpyrimidine/phosphomethylpyrimidine kinase